MLALKNLIHQFLNHRGYEIIQYPVIEFFRRCNFDTVLDVGANNGGFAKELRSKYGYRGKIISFEPLASAFQELSTLAARDNLWNAVNYALGSSDGSFEIHVAGNSVSSSFLPMLPRHTDAAPQSRTIAVEKVQVKTLDSVFHEFCQPNESVLLKIDTQGFELEVLKGAATTLKQVKAVQLELNLSALYQNAPLAEVVIAYLREAGFSPFWFTGGFRDPVTSQLLQMDGYFLNESIKAKD